MAQLAIRGHETRGKEVIEILEMLGGINDDIIGTETSWVYTIDEEEFIDMHFPCDRYSVYSLEDFLEKFPYRVGDKVIHGEDKDMAFAVVKMYWDDEFDIVRYDVQSVADKNISLYELMVAHLKPYKEERQYKELRMPLDNDDKLATEATIDGNKILPPNGYLIGKITQVDNGMLVEYVKKQPRYPKTFIEVLNFWHPDRQIEDDYQRCYKKDLIEKFQDLLYARDAYWKIAGEQMGLDKPWAPDWKDTDIDLYVIINICNQVEKAKYGYGFQQCIFTFPTEEMRDAFYENFKDLIESCKELL